MPAEPGTVERPLHPLHQMTTYELCGYRRNLENAIKGIAPEASVQAVLRRRLDDVLAEQQDRHRIASASR